MPITKEQMRALLPKVRPPKYELTDSERTTLNRLIKRNEELLQTAFLWNRYLTNRLMGRRVIYEKRLFDSWWGVPYPYGYTIGFVPIGEYLPNSELIGDAARRIGWVYGIARMFEGNPEECSVSAFDVDGEFRVPVVSLPGIYQEHSPPNPFHATSGCWAVRGADAAIGDLGVLIAKHAIKGLTRGSSIPLDNGNFGTLIDFCPGSIDGALLGVNGVPPTTKSQITILKNPVDGEIVHFDGVKTKGASGQIVSSFYFPDNPDPYNTMRVYLDFYGQQGDSGALVYDTNSGGGVAIYTGVFPTGGKMLGRCQYLKQATDLMNLTIYEP